MAEWAEETARSAIGSESSCFASSSSFAASVEAGPSVMDSRRAGSELQSCCLGSVASASATVAATDSD